jgi:hypothetical protein
LGLGASIFLIGTMKLRMTGMRARRTTQQIKRKNTCHPKNRTINSWNLLYPPKFSKYLQHLFPKYFYPKLISIFSLQIEIRHRFLWWWRGSLNKFRFYKQFHWDVFKIVVLTGRGLISFWPGNLWIFSGPFPSNYFWKFFKSVQKIHLKFMNSSTIQTK